jgi:ABC-type transporter MlaC component
MIPGKLLPNLIGARVRRTDRQLQIIDISVAGVSLLKTQRDDFSAVLAKQGFAGLLEEMRSRVRAVGTASRQ